MAKINATGFKLYVMDGNPAVKRKITEQTTLSSSNSTATIDVTSKDNNGYGDFLGGLKDGDISVDMFVDFAPIDNGVNFMEMKAIDAAKSRRDYVVECATPEGKLFSWKFNGLITKFDADLTMESGAKVSMSIKRNGADTVTLV